MNNFNSFGGVLAAGLRLVSEHSAFADFLYKSTTRFDRLAAIVSAKTGSLDDHVVVDRYMDRHVERFRVNVLTGAGIGMSHDVPLAWALQPTQLGGPQTSEHEKSLLNAIPEKWHNIDYVPAKQIFCRRTEAAFDQLASRFSNSDDVRILNLSRMFDAKSPSKTLYVDHVHYTPEGNRLIAAALFESLYPRLNATASSP